MITKKITISTLKTLAFLLIFSSILTSCKTLTSNRMFSTDSSYPYSSFEESKPEYIIHPYDKLSIKVYTNKGDRLIDVKGELKNMQDPIIYSVEHDGQVKVPTIGRINLAGLTLRQAETLLEESYKAYYNDPFVFIQVTNKRVIVFNSGSSGGHVVNFDNENYTLIEALAEAGGISDVGKAYKIKLLRGDLNNPEVYTFNVRKLKDIKSVNFQLQANDIIYVEDRPRYGSKVLQEVMPYLTLFTSVFTVYLLVSK